MKWWSMIVAPLFVLIPAVAGAEMLSVSVSTANFRDAPSQQAAVLYTADIYYPVKILERQAEWCKVEDFEGEVAWVAERLLAKRKSVVVNVEKAIVRQATTTDSEIAFTADWGEALAVQQRSDDWLQVESKAGQRGWVHINVVWGLEAPPAPKPTKSK